MAIIKTILKSITLLLLMGTFFACNGDENSTGLRENENPVEGQFEDTLQNTQDQNVETSPIEMTQDELNQLLSDFQTGKQSFDFYAVFTEPFWMFYFFENNVLFIGIDMEGPLLLPLEYPFNPNARSQILRFSMFGDLWELQVSNEVGSEGMSDIEYPYSVKYNDLVGAGSTEPMRGSK